MGNSGTKDTSHPPAGTPAQLKFLDAKDVAQRAPAALPDPEPSQPQKEKKPIDPKLQSTTVSPERLAKLLEKTYVSDDRPSASSSKQQAFQKLCQPQKAPPSKDMCPICLCECDDDVVTLGKCPTHPFHMDCIIHCYKEKQNCLKCPVCGKIYGIQMGSMPYGTMNVEKSNSRIPGCGLFSGTITINYNFPDGIQTEEHQNPGQPYSGTSRTAYLPDNEEGRKVLKLLEIAFERKLTFRIGLSITNGCDNCVVWNGIHHKTSTSGGFQNFGYPDDTYLERVTDELKAVGVEL